MKIKIPEKISMGMVYACMGFGNKEPDENSLELIQNCSKLILNSAVPHAVYKEFQIGVTESLKEIYIANEKNRLSGKAIVEHLEGCNKCVLMAVTLGPEVDKLIRRMQIKDMAAAVALDACASSLTEDLCDEIFNHIEEQYGKNEMGLTSRFSPGYGDLSLENQDIFSNLLEMEKKIGLTQSSNYLLLPRKSITAIIGIYPLGKNKTKRLLQEEENEKHSACQICERKNNCQFILKGWYCGKK